MADTGAIQIASIIIKYKCLVCYDYVFNVMVDVM